MTYGVPDIETTTELTGSLCKTVFFFRMSFHTATDMGPPRIHTVVAARSAALKIKQLSSSPFTERRKRQDKGDFAVTFSDDPTNSLETITLPRQEERHGIRRSVAIPPTFSRGSVEQPIQRSESHNSTRLEQGEVNRGRSVATFSSGFSDPLVESELENAPQVSRQGDESPRHRRKRHTVVTKPPITVSVEYERLPEAGLYNTYRLEPVKKFEHCKVTEIIKETFEEHLIGENYDHEVCHHMSKILADVIKEKIKSLQFSRYKIISVVSVGQKRGQSVTMISRSVWDPRFDSYAQYSFEREDIFAIGIVYGIYFE